MRVEVRNAVTKKVDGNIDLTDGVLRFDDSLLFLRQMPVQVTPGGTERVKADDDPEKFIRALPEYLTNGYIEAELFE